MVLRAILLAVCAVISHLVEFTDDSPVNRTATERGRTLSECSVAFWIRLTWDSPPDLVCQLHPS